MVRAKTWKGIAVGFSLLLLVTGPALAYYDEYGDSESHPLRLAAYALHPAGCAIEWLVIRPLHAIVSQPQLAHLFGHRPHEANFSCGYTPAAAVPPPVVSSTLPRVAPPPLTSQPVPQEEVAEARKAAEEARQAAEEAKRAAQAAEAAAQRTERVFERTLRK